MKRKILAASALALFAAAAGAAQDPRAATPSTTAPGTSSSSAPMNSSTPATGSGEFARLDTDGDGIVSKKEAAKSADLKKQWSKLDANKDGKLDSMEFSQFEMGSSSSSTSSPNNSSGTTSPTTKY